MNRRCILLILVVLGTRVPLLAQTVTSYTFKIYNQGATAPVTTTVLPTSVFLCGVARVAPSGTVQNPVELRFDDPADAAKDCVYTDPGAGPLLSLPFGSQIYVATLVATNGAGTSAESGPSNSFARPGLAPGIPAGVRVVR